MDLLGDPWAVVNHADLDDVIARLGEQTDIPTVLISDRLRRIAQQVQKDLLDLDLVGKDGGTRRIILDRDADPSELCADKR